MMKKGINPFLATTLLILFAISALSLTLTIVKPALERAQDSAIVNEAMNNLKLIDSIVKEVASEEKGSKRTLNIKSSDGLFEVDSNLEYINYTYDMRQDLNLGGSRDEINITTERNVIKLFVNYDKVDLIGNAHIPKGSKQITIKHEGTNTANNKPMINITI